MSTLSFSSNYTVLEVLHMYYPRLRDLREDADKAQKEIAAILGIDQRVYSNYETGKREIPVHHLIILADYYGTTIDYIVGRE
jgi:transcriptional regulator with XRE-family HTH domain